LSGIGKRALKSILLIFEVHQPFRLKRDFLWAKRAFRKLDSGGLKDHYFDSAADREIFERAARKCYLPANAALLRAIEEEADGGRRAKLAFSISGTFLDQCELYGKEVLEGFRKLAGTGSVEFLGQTYYHSLSSLYQDKGEFEEQVRLQGRAVKELLGASTSTFENTELVYNNTIAKAIASLGFKAICTEGAERVLGARSSNYIYEAAGSGGLKVILRNYRLTDDVGFRFSDRRWSEWPLTASKYASWLSGAEGDSVCIFPDYETFGEHHWPETGIHDFLAKLPEEILKRDDLKMELPSEYAGQARAVDVLDVAEPQTISWADIERGTASWIGNSMQWAYFTSVREMEPLVKESGSQDVMRTWRLLGVSDHLYYMFTGGGGPGTVHSYFSPYGSAAEAFVGAQAAAFDFEWRVREAVDAANEPFEFHRSEGEKGFIGVRAWSLAGFWRAVSKVPPESLLFHLKRGDFVAWARGSLKDEDLAHEMEMLGRRKPTGETVRTEIRKLAAKRLNSRKAYLKALGLNL
jgi:alpha-amylase